MPEIKPQDYTPLELTQAANVCRDAAKALEPVTNELKSMIEDLEHDNNIEDALLFARTRRYLLRASFHLLGGAGELRQIAGTIGGSYSSVKSKFLGLNLAGWTAAIVITLLKLILPEHAGNIAVQLAPIGIGFAIGATVSLAVFEHYVTRARRTDGRKQ